MAASKNTRGIVLWLLAGTGVILMYSAYKNISPTSLISKTIGAAKSVVPLTIDTAAATAAAEKAKGTQTAKDLYGIDPDAPTPNTPDNVPGTNTPNFWGITGSNYTGKGPDGIEYEYNSQGLQLYPLPAAYQNNPNSYIPAAGTLSA